MPSFHNGTDTPDHCPSRPHLFGRRMVVIKQMRWGEGHVCPFFFGHEDKNARPEARGMAQRRYGIGFGHMAWIEMGTRIAL